MVSLLLLLIVAAPSSGHGSGVATSRVADLNSANQKHHGGTSLSHVVHSACLSVHSLIQNIQTATGW